MILDKEQQLASAQTLTATGASTNVIDLGADRDVGIGEPLAVVIVVTAIDATSSDETYAVQMQADDNSGFSSAASVGGSLSISRSVSVPYKTVQYLPADQTTERYFRLNWTLGGTTPSITYSAYLQPARMVQNNVLYADGISIS